MEKLKVFEAFAGLGSQVMALKKLDINFESVGIAEIDKYADKAYKFIHGEINNYGDISKIDWNDVPYFDLFTYSFPCQDLSLAGKRKGLVKGSGTRSSLLWECEKAIEIKRPAYLLLENVKGLITEKMKPHFFEWLKILENLGYCNYWKVMNAKDYGIPQNRERVFVVSIRNDINLKRDILEPNMFERLTYEFPKPFDNGLRLKHFLETEVDEKYFLSEKMLKCLIGRGKIAKGYEFKIKDKNYYANCIVKKAGNYSTDNYISENELKVLYTDEANSQAYRVYSADNIATTQSAEGGGMGAKTGLYEINEIIPTQIGNSKKRKNFIGKPNNPAMTIRTQEPNGIILNNRIRRLTMLECWRLMGFSETDFNKVRPHLSDTQLYKQAGNSIVVSVLEFIFYELFKNDFEIKRNPYNYYKNEFKGYN